jgi:tRNA G18 (ribose-2'-O)-methylase SpoU
MAVMPVSQATRSDTKQAHQPLPLEVLLDNLRSVYNVGSIFRTADGAGVRQIHLCGISPTPKHRKLAKTALGAAEAVPWTVQLNGLQKAVALKEQGYQLWALEESPHAESLFDVTIQADDPPIALILGNEVIGVDPGILAQCDKVLYIPMVGQKESLNVAVAFGIAVYYLLHVR